MENTRCRICTADTTGCGSHVEKDNWYIVIDTDTDRMWKLNKDDSLCNDCNKDGKLIYYRNVDTL